MPWPLLPQKPAVVMPLDSQSSDTFSVAICILAICVCDRGFNKVEDRLGRFCELGDRESGSLIGQIADTMIIR
jgi:hypothetical protein